ncbi:MAG TPA: vanadium-dependent haloperoxidase [Streptosporangiaceae bacterium]|nr:vanadium-dependent haloperoxidase [Streptosporangiaceae bacterium]
MRTFTREKQKPGASRTRRAIAAAITAAAAAATVSTTLASPASAAATLAATGARQASGAGQSGAAFRPGSGQLVVTWNKELIKILGIPGQQPATVHPTRSFALLQAAEYDAVNSITRHDRPYLFSVRAPRDARPDAAADQAAHDVLAALYPSMQGELGGLLHAELAKIPGGHSRNDGTQVGAAVARHLLGLRAHDGSTATPPPFVSGNLPGDYRPTPPDFLAPVFTGWGKVTPFVLENGRQFRPAAPPPVTSAAYAAALNEVKSKGRDNSRTRTKDQTAEAVFWASAPVWNTWNQVAQGQVLRDGRQGASLERTTALFASLDFALADATIAMYNAKYRYAVWRPVTAIRLANTIHNPAIRRDKHWNPLAVTAPDPSYPGAHSTISEAAATVLSAFDGSRVHLAITLNGVTRTFGSFQAAANEAGLSRIFAGQHTRLDHQAGERLGGRVAAFVLGHFFNGHSTGRA